MVLEEGRTDAGGVQGEGKKSSCQWSPEACVWGAGTTDSYGVSIAQSAPDDSISF